MIAIQEKAGKKRIKTKSKKSERGQLRGGWWQKNGNNHRYSGPQDRRTFADPENFFVKKINTCETHNLDGNVQYLLTSIYAYHLLCPDNDDSYAHLSRGI